jgi:myo-inositol 2-dehydrogenase/D-chiro-inositol 1-dehydrogenase
MVPVYNRPMRVGLIGVGRMGRVHAATLAGLAAIDELVLADADAALAGQVAAAIATRSVGGAGRVRAAGSIDALWREGLGGVVIATPTATHADLIVAAAAAGLPVFCEKPVALDPAGTRAVLAQVAAAGVPLQVGFQRRFDPGFAAARDAVRSGRLGWIHTLRACTCDPAPPHASYLPGSGGLFRDCSVHDFDAIRWVTGREIVRVQAAGANRGDLCFTEAGDVDTGAALLELDDGALAVCTATRYNGAGYDVRLEVCGSAGSLVAGLDDRAPLPPSPPVDRPRAPAYTGFADRFADAYAAELAAFVEVAAGRQSSPCTGQEALAALLVAEAADRSRREHRPVEIAEVVAQ